MPCKESYRASIQESHSQFDSEVRFNAMIRNSEKLRRVNDQLSAILDKSKTEKNASSVTASTLYQADEVLAMLSVKELKSLHSAFVSRNGCLNFTEFVEVGRCALQSRTHMQKTDAALPAVFMQKHR